MSLSPELTRIYASGGPQDFYYETLSLAHPLFTSTWFITNNSEGFSAQLENGGLVTFEPYPFIVTLAASGESGNQDIEVSISNVDRKPIDEIERASEQPTQQIEMVYRVYAGSDLSQPGQVIDGLSVASITVGENQIGAVASPSDLLNRVFPSRLYTTAEFPGLYHV